VGGKGEWKIQRFRIALWENRHYNKGVIVVKGDDSRKEENYGRK